MNKEHTKETERIHQLEEGIYYVLNQMRRMDDNAYLKQNELNEYFLKLLHREDVSQFQFESVLLNSSR